MSSPAEGCWTDVGLLGPGAHRAGGRTDDQALLAVMLQVEVAWVRALVAGGAARTEQADAVAAAVGAGCADLRVLAAATEDAANPVVALVASLRAAIADEEAAALVHRGLTSQDVLDTSLMLLARDVLDQLVADLDHMADRLAVLAEQHRGSVMAGRTLTQHAVPTTFGLKAAQWLAGVLDAADAVARVRADLPVQCGGAAGTLSLAGELLDPVAAAAVLADELGLVAPPAPWHTRRTPVTRVADALVEVVDALGVVAVNVTVLSRPEIAELGEGAAAGRGGSSTMPQKQNPVLAVLVRAAALQAPLLGAQVHLSAAQAVDERPDGAWHAEWPAYRRLLMLALVSTGQARELVSGLEVHAETMRRRAQDEVAVLLAERHGSAAAVPSNSDPASYLGAAGELVDAVLRRHRAGTST